MLKNINEKLWINPEHIVCVTLGYNVDGKEICNIYFDTGNTTALDMTVEEFLNKIK